MVDNKKLEELEIFSVSYLFLQKIDEINYKLKKLKINCLTLTKAAEESIQKNE